MIEIHAYWQKDHDKVMKEIQKEQELAENYPYVIKVPNANNKQWYERWHWCGENFTKETYRYSFGYMKFQREEDAIFFALRWA